MYIVTEGDQHLQNFIHNVNTLREQNRLTRRQMADILHITPYMLRLLEKGQIELPQNIQTAQKGRYVGKKQGQQECRSESGGAPVFD